MQMKKLALFGATALAVLAIPASSAMAWSPSGNYDLDGHLTTTIHNGTYGDAWVDSDASFNADLYSGSSNGGDVLSASFSGTSSSSGYHTVVTTNLSTTTWPITGNGTSQKVTISGVNFTATLYPLWPSTAIALNATVAGSVSGTYDGSTGTLTFDSSGADANYASSLKVQATPSIPTVSTNDPADLDGSVTATSGPPALQ